MAYVFPYSKAASQKILKDMLIKTIHAPPYAIAMDATGSYQAQPVSVGRARRALAWHLPG